MLECTAADSVMCLHCPNIDTYNLAVLISLIWPRRVTRHIIPSRSMRLHLSLLVMPDGAEEQQALTSRELGRVAESSAACSTTASCTKRMLVFSVIICWQTAAVTCSNPSPAISALAPSQLMPNSQADVLELFSLACLSAEWPDWHPPATIR